MMKNPTNSDYHCIPLETDQDLWNSIIELHDTSLAASSNQSKRIEYDYPSDYFGELEVSLLRVHESEPAFKCYDENDFFLYSYCQIWRNGAGSMLKNHSQNEPCFLVCMFANYTSDGGYYYAFVHDKFLKQADQSDLRNKILYGILQRGNAMDHVKGLPSKMLRHARMYDYIDKMLPDNDEIIEKICTSRWEDYTLSDCYEETMIANQSNGPHLQEHKNTQKKLLTDLHGNGKVST